MSERVNQCKHGRNFCLECHDQKSDYDALHAEAEALRAALLGIASVNPAERGIEWAKSYASDGLKGAGSELYARWLDTFNEAEALQAENAKLRDKYDRDVYGLNNEGDPIGGEPAGGYANDNARLRAELEAARGLLAQLRGMINCTAENDADKMPVWISTKHPVIERIDAFLTATPAPEVKSEQGERQEASQDVRGLVEAVKGVKLTPSDMRHWGRGSVWWNNAVEACLDAINSAHRQAQRQ